MDCPVICGFMTVFVAVLGGKARENISIPL